MTLTQGRLLDERDIRNRTAVAVVDGKTIESLLGKVDPVGQVVLVGIPCRCASWGWSPRRPALAAAASRSMSGSPTAPS